MVESQPSNNFFIFEPLVTELARRVLKSGVLKMKVKEKQQARKLRSEGCSVREIANKVGVAKGTVSVWVRDIKLTKEQVDTLSHRNPVFQGQCAGASANKEKWAEKRKAWREEGRQEADTSNWLHVSGCMLYWAEGWRRNNRATVAFSNSDVDMLRLFVRFLREFYEVHSDEISIAINCYTDVNSSEECESYWLDSLGLERENLKKTIADNRPACTQRRRNSMVEFLPSKQNVASSSLVVRSKGQQRSTKD